jgi:cytosine/adenosine deaminase-related metal-dependent hydrolase
MGAAGDLRDGAVLIDGTTIAAVGSYPELRAEHPDAPVVGDEHGIVIPGLVNAHDHLSEAFVSGMGENLALFEWARSIVVPAGLHLTREMARVGTLLKGFEMLRSGVTCVNDMFGHMNLGHDVSLGVVDGLDDLGLRGVVSFGAADDPTGDLSFELSAIVDEHHALAARAAKSERVGFRLGLATLLVATDGLLERSVSEAHANGWGVHTHLAEVREEFVDARLRWGETSIRHAESIGLLDLDVVAGHVIWVGADEFAVLADHGTKAVYNPVANMILADGVCPVRDLRDAGVAVAIGTDGSASNDSANLFEAMKLGSLLQKVTHLDPAWTSARDMLRMATVDGAAVLGLPGVGALEPGRCADVVRLSGDGPGLANVHDPYQQLVYCAGPVDVADVWVDGQRLLDGGRPTTVDPAEVVAASRTLGRTLTEAAGGFGGLSSLLG